jgi:hypothetical protein
MVGGRVVAAPEDGSLGPLLRLADDRLAPGEGYGVHAHRAVDVVAVVLTGSLRHAWGDGAVLRAGDVAVLRAGEGLEHDEIAGDDGARVLQAYLRPAGPPGPPSHVVHRAVAGWVDLGRPDARLWVGPPGPDVPDGQLDVDAGERLVVWRSSTDRPRWADF